MNHFYEAKQLSIYLNPTHGFLTLKWRNTQNQDFELILLNSLGEKIKEFKYLKGKRVELDIKDLNPGLYHLSISSGAGLLKTGNIILQ
jgi:Secretion system C-terminal sorting domain